MVGKASAVAQRPTKLPAKYTRGFAWKLSKRSEIAREIAADLWQLWTDLGGVESLSVQKLWLCERVVYLRRRCLAYEAAVLAGTDPPMDAGTYSNHANVLQGYLRTLGLDRKARDAALDVREYLATSVSKGTP
jgi:hypothetical protein